jgi:TolB protein
MRCAWFRPRGLPGAAPLMIATLLAGCAVDSPSEGGVAAVADTLSLAERGSIPGWIAFVSERGGEADAYRIRPTGAEEQRLTSGSAADYPAAAAPDGAALLLVRTEEVTRGPGTPVHREQLLLQPLSSGRQTRLGPASARSRSPSISPDGAWVVFESDSASFRDLYRIGRDGQGLRRLTDDPEGNFEPAVSPDGEHIAFVSSRDGNAEVYRMRADGSGEQRLTAFHRDDVSPRWSQDGRWIAFVSSREGDDRIFLMRPDGTGQRKLNREGDTPESASMADLQEGDLAWSPDGQRIAHTTRERSGRTRIWVTDVDTGERTPLTDGASRDEMPTWSPDGRYLAFVSDRDGDPELYLMRADGTAPTRLTRAPGADWLPRWVPESGRSRTGGGAGL